MICGILKWLDTKKKLDEIYLFYDFLTIDIVSSSCRVGLNNLTCCIWRPTCSLLVSGLADVWEFSKDAAVVSEALFNCYMKLQGGVEIFFQWFHSSLGWFLCYIAFLSFFSRAPQQLPELFLRNIFLDWYCRPCIDSFFKRTLCQSNICCAH